MVLGTVYHRQSVIPDAEHYAVESLAPDTRSLRGPGLRLCHGPSPSQARPGRLLSIVSGRSGNPSAPACSFP
eukprot:1361841-Rhodomonas_salina.1